ncbi:prolyl oligopeptidase family serine peptidase [Uruburuella testudinis]|uniref:Prolyl oligopeptidase family serine peptidase n=1 Tax=Uruburuella testudinis TaxID=1282863 RepID=A0ABY4DUK7_9NEIS|nr:alpha/beta hydrolase-fold protein [Uruburuella testudinis]UOO81684.1 prolyl oligopeptidase family serine peptidase [Uruburuella testudinis]
MLRIIVCMTALLLAAHSHSATPPDMSRKADFSVFAAPDSGYHFTTLDFPAANRMPPHRVYVGIPAAAPPAGGFPALFALDGNALPELLDAARLRRLAAESPPVLVLIGYANDLRFDGAARAYDYTPPDTGGQPLTDDFDPARRNGGAAAFLQLIHTQIRPAVADLAPLNPQRQTLWGHSYGGLFVLYTLLQQPDAFTQYIAADPSLWWQRGLFLKQAEQAFRRPLSFPPHTQLWLHQSGLKEAKTARNPQQQQRIAARDRAIAAVPPDAAKTLAAQLAQQPGLTVHYQNHPQHSHGSLLAASFQTALTLAAEAKPQ